MFSSRQLCSHFLQWFENGSLCEETSFKTCEEKHFFILLPISMVCIHDKEDKFEIEKKFCTETNIDMSECHCILELQGNTF
mmetsp:Transcript_10543/g.24088  ORF Transcript_10543/g.24088 Transcript_10543/m.24088 type:complete len:81 (+) Transcript_10543:1255-1497(+)